MHSWAEKSYFSRTIKVILNHDSEVLKDIPSSHYRLALMCLTNSVSFLSSFCLH